MENNLRKALLKTALITSPIIALLVATPVFIVSTISIKYFPLILFFITMASLFSWWLQRSTVTTKPIYRFLISVLIMLLISSVVAFFVVPPFEMPFVQFSILRIVNIIAINAIVFVLMEIQIVSNRKVKLEIENNALSISNLKAQIQNLKSQINPHFFFNSLSTLKSLVKRNPEIAEVYIVKLSEFLRQSIKNKSDLVSLEDEIQLCREYIDLEKMRFANALFVNLQIDSSIMKNKIPFFSIQSLIENAIKHNLMSLERPLTIDITNSGNYIQVRNNMQEKIVISNASKTGLINLSERVILLCKEDLQIEKNETEFIVRIKSLPE